MKKIYGLFAAMCVALCAPTASAALLTHTFDMEGVTGTGGFFDEFPSLDFDFGIAGTVVGVEFELTLEAFDPSWTSEAIIFVDGSEDGLGDFDAWISGDYGAADDPGVFSYADAFAVEIDSPTGYVAITAADSFTDDVDPNHVYLAGSFITVTFDDGTTVPEPATCTILGLGLVGAGIAARRRLAK